MEQGHCLRPPGRDRPSRAEVADAFTAPPVFEPEKAHQPFESVPEIISAEGQVDSAFGKSTVQVEGIETAPNRPTSNG
jgi:hypothetical protein